MVAFRTPKERKSGYDPKGDIGYTVTNDLDFSISLNWLNYDGNPVHYGDVAVGGSYNGTTNTEHPWLLRSLKDESEVACVCFTGGEVKLSEAMKPPEGPLRETKSGYLAADGDFAAGVSQEEAEQICMLNPGKVMGYCYRT